MSARPWVTPEEIKEYTDFEDVAARTDTKLRKDIARAEIYILSYTNNKELLDDKLYPTVPEGVKTAVIILAEAYGHNAVEKTKTLKSETFDDYSYTSESNTVDLNSIYDEIAALLEDFKKAKSNNLVNMSLRKL